MTTYIHNVRLESHFTVTYNCTPEDPRLSWGAKGLLWYILSRPANWKIHTEQLAELYEGEKRGSGMRAIKGFIKELRGLEYLVYEKKPGSNGHWEHHYHAYPMPLPECQKMLPECVKAPLLNAPLLKSPILTSTECSSSSSSSSLRSEEDSSEDQEQERKEEKRVSARMRVYPPYSHLKSVPVPFGSTLIPLKFPVRTIEHQVVPVLSFGTDGLVKLTQAQHDKLKEKITNLDELIEELNDYIASTGKRYKCHAATLRQWNRKALKAKKNPPSVNRNVSGWGDEYDAQYRSRKDNIEYKTKKEINDSRKRNTEDNKS